MTVIQVQFRKNGPRLMWKRGTDHWYAFTGPNCLGWRLSVYSMITVIGDHQANREFDDDVLEMARAERKCAELVRKRFGGVL